MKSKRIVIFLILLTTFNFFLFSKDLNQSKQNSNLPNGYSNIKLGMTVEETKSELKKNSDFGYHGDRDVSLLPDQNKVLIETDADKGLGSNFLNRCWFQFQDDSLYIITINMNTEKIDYYSVFTTLTKKYGNPISVDPEKATWKNEQITMTLEKPLTLKYIDNETYSTLQKESQIQKSATEVTREMFLEEL